MPQQHAFLVQNQAYIKGEWVGSDSGQSFSVFNPYDGAHLADVPDMGAAETERAIQAAWEAFPAWAKKTAGDRAELLRRWCELQREHTEELANLLTSEQGKPLAEARGEVQYGASFVEWFAEEARRVYGDVMPSHTADKRLLALKQPIGVVGAITPWNFPNAMINRKVAPALAAGCTVVIKPAEDTPLSALALAMLAEKAGFPPGVINVVTTQDPREVGAELTGNPIVRKISFTGSTAVGKILMAQCASTVKKISLELGGNAPFIVFDDADLDEAVAGAMASKYRNAGQTCVCANRIYVQDGVYEAFAAKMVEASKALAVGAGHAPETKVGPLINEAGLQKVERLVADAVQQGASVLTGGQTLDVSQGHFYEPTVLTDVKPEMAISKEEIFGPVAPLYRFQTDDEVIALANNTRYGLAAYFYGRDIARIWRVAEALEYGMVGINTGMISTPHAPFGGVKESGIGREGSRYGIEEFVEIKYLCFGGIE